jgi:hypothetical protein
MSTFLWKRLAAAPAVSEWVRRSIPTRVPFLVTAVVALIWAAPMRAQYVLTFEGLQNEEPILNYYNGGYGGNGSGPGPSYGITFGASALALNSGNFSRNPTPPSILFFLSGSGAVMNVPAGFMTGFSFYYASSVTGSVTVWDQTGATGNLLATVNLPATPLNCVVNVPYSCWVPVGVSFSGTAKSVDFAGGADYIAFDNITFGSATPSSNGTPPAPTGVPTLSKWAMMLLAIGLIFVVSRRLRGYASERL